ncbi:MAG: hypothetical protein RLZZ267_308 [Bacillota bacterium]|jgi:hypothetical protein
MSKLMMVILILPVLFILQVIQQDLEHASHVYFRSKHGLNHAVQAAVQQIDTNLLSDGIIDLDAVLAEQVLKNYLMVNLKVDSQLIPTAGSFLRDPIQRYRVIYIDHLRTFPYELNTELGDIIQFQRPGVYLECQIQYPRLYGLLPPIKWDIRSAGQVVPLPPR